MTSETYRVLVLLSLLGVVSGADCLAALWSSSSLVAHFTADGRLSRLQNCLTDEEVILTDSEEFSFVVNGEEIRTRDCRLDSVRETERGPEATYLHPEFEIRVSYSLEPDSHFLLKRVVLLHTGDEAFALNRCSLHRWAVESEPGQLLPFRHGQAVTYFLRRQRGGFFWGVQCPFEEVLPADSRFIDLAYPVGLILEAGSTYSMEPAYWGVYEQTGRYAPKVPERIKESLLSRITPDAGESEAMLRMVRRLSQRPPKVPTVVFNGYQGGLFFGDYGDPDGLKQAEYDIETLALVESALGPCFVQPASPWFGAYRQATVLTPTSETVKVPPARQRLIQWINSKGMKPMGWSSVKAVHGWVKPRLGPYCPDYSEWLGNPSENCPANPEFMKWFARLLINDLENGFHGFTSDEPGPTVPRFHFECQQLHHSHLPGDASYAYFFWERWLFRQLRDAFGESFELQGQRPQMDAGIWHAIYLNSVFTLEESPGKSADKMRRWARIRRHYTFTPSYMDQLMVQPGMDQIDYTMLSALAVSSNYLFVAPCTPETLPAHLEGIRVQNNRYMAKAWRSFPEDQRKRLRFWLDWGRENGEYMGHVYDLPEWPGEGGPDGYLRITGGRGFAFLFNSTNVRQMIKIPLDEKVGLDSGSDYFLKQLYPESGRDRERFKKETRFVVKPGSAYLIQIDPI